MSWSNNPWTAAQTTKDWATVAPAQPIAPANPWDALGQDELLVKHQKLQEDLATLKADELELRKYIVNRAFPNKHEGTNTLELGNNYNLKASIKYNYNLDKDLDNVEKALNDIASMGNEGSFIADRIVKWEASLVLSEYRNLQETDITETQKFIKKRIDQVLTITDAAPSLTISKSKK